MKPTATFFLATALVAWAQSDLIVGDDMLNPEAAPTEPAAIPAEPAAIPDLPPPPPAPVTPTPAVDEAMPSVEPVAPPAETPAEAEEEDAILESEEGYLIKDAPLNDILQFLAKQAGRQYFHNVKIATPEYRVTGHLNDGNPLQQMEELAFMYGLMLYTKGNTVYALTQTQLTQLPSTEATYQLCYLRPEAPEEIKNLTDLVKDVLSPGTGICRFEPKTNSLVIIDTAHRIEHARELLRKVDQPKGQIIVETKILRVNSKAAERVGVDWASTLGSAGVSIDILRSLNSVFGLNSTFSEAGYQIIGAGDTVLSSGQTSNLVLDPVQLSGVLRALAEGGLATQVSNPTLITEDNEQGTISIIDRIPIITTTSTQTTSGGNPTVTEEVRYKIDEGDQSITEAPEKHREIGISMVATPSLLPDGTIRMSLRPRSAQITDYVKSVYTGNAYPRVTESMIESTTRIPNGYSLVIGGFYGETQSKDGNKVPVLGDIPIINFFFKSRETVKEQASLVFIVTPTSYDPTSRSATGRVSNEVHGSVSLTRDHDWVDPVNPGPAHEPNLRRGIRGLQPREAPYYPTTGASTTEAPAVPAAEPSSSTSHSPRFNRSRY